jgi:hypothetical protein
MKDLSTLFLTVYSGSLPLVFNELDDKAEQEERLNVESLLLFIKKIIEKTDVAKITAVLSNLESLENYINWIEHPIYLNEFKDKKGNRYLQGRTSIKGMDGKTKWISAYVGSLNEYPKGVTDPEAFRKAKPIIRKKLKKYYGL